MDYELRGPGDIMGTMQSGNASNDILLLSRYTDILENAISDADKIMEEYRGGGSLTDVEYAYERLMHADAADNSNVI